MVQRKTSKTKMYEMQAQICGALAHPVRLHIVDLLSGGEKTSAQLLETLEIPKANLSQHLTVMKQAGIIQSRREGLFQYVSLSVPEVTDACSLVKKVLFERMSQSERMVAEFKRELKSGGRTK